VCERECGSVYVRERYREWLAMGIKLRRSVTYEGDDVYDFEKNSTLMSMSLFWKIALIL